MFAENIEVVAEIKFVHVSARVLIIEQTIYGRTIQYLTGSLTALDWRQGRDHYTSPSLRNPILLFEGMGCGYMSGMIFWYRSCIFCESLENRA